MSLGNYSAPLEKKAGNECHNYVAECRTVGIREGILCWCH